MYLPFATGVLLFFVGFQGEAMENFKTKLQAPPRFSRLFRWGFP